jgi:hypothetical protein
LFSLSIWLHLFVLLKVNPYCHVYGRKVSSVGQWSIGWSCTRSIEYIRNDTKYFCQAQIQLKRGEVIGYKGGRSFLVRNIALISRKKSQYSKRSSNTEVTSASKPHLRKGTYGNGKLATFQCQYPHLVSQLGKDA